MAVRWVWLFLDLPSGSSRGPWRSGARSPAATVGLAREYREFATLLPAQGDPWLKVQRVGGEGVHLDLDVDEPLPMAAERGWRARRRGVGDLGDVVVCRSPGGFVFCLTPWPPTRRAGAGALRRRQPGRPGVPGHPPQACMPARRSGPRSPGGRPVTIPTPRTSSRGSPGPRDCPCGTSYSGSTSARARPGARRPRPLSTARRRWSAPWPGRARGGAGRRLDGHAPPGRAPLLRTDRAPRASAARTPARLWSTVVTTRVHSRAYGRAGAGRPA